MFVSNISNNKLVRQVYLGICSTERDQILMNACLFFVYFNRVLNIKS